MEIKEIATIYGGISDTGTGKLTVKFKAPMSEGGLFTRLFLLTAQQVFVFVKWESQNEKGEPIERDEQLGVFVYDGKNEDGKGECTMRFIGDVNSLDDAVFAQMRKDCVKGLTGDGKIVYVTVWDSEEARKQNQTIAP